MSQKRAPFAKASGAGALLRILGVSFGLAVIVGSTIGVGILRTPGTVASQLGSPKLFLAVWVLGGLYTLVGAVCMTELGTALPQVGGYYVYARRAFGERVGFATGWTDWLTYCSILGYVSIAIGEFSVQLVPSLVRIGGGVAPVAVAALVFFAALQWAGLRVSSRAQEVTTLVKFLAFLALVVACFSYSSPVASGAIPSPAPGLATFIAVALALQSVVVTYGGWQSALYFSEENRDPARNLPRAMIGSVLLVLVVYLLVNLALLRVLPLSVLAASKLPAADAATSVFGAGGGRLITLLSLVSLLPLINAILMIGTRILYAMSRDHTRWTAAAGVTPRGTPLLAMLVTAGGGIVLAASGTFEKLVALAAFFLAANYLVSCLALVALRRREPSLERPFRAWGYPWSAALVVLGALLFLGGVVVGDTRNSLYALGLVAASFPLRYWASSGGSGGT